MHTLPFADIPGNHHQVSPSEPTRVTSARTYRASWAGIIEAGDPQFQALAQAFEPPHRPAATFAAIGLESQEHALIWLGAPQVLTHWALHQDDGLPIAALNQHGAFGEHWPADPAWRERIPTTTWNPDGQGIVTELDFPDGDGRVVVYELLGKPAMLPAGVSRQPVGPVPVVTWHCTRCHSAGDTLDRYASASPAERREAARAARRHLRPGRCRGASARLDQALAAVDRVVTGRPESADPTGLYAAWCQTKTTGGCTPGMVSSCAEVREARTHTARHRMATCP
ncbi:hypothetical protein ACSNOI_03245 [Actinomadura kijaniata]|uniref:hypothetical protein n=1 Tax=Actinomadura kijaniata TaxID=46161 RepID=UPI003F1C355A